MRTNEWRSDPRDIRRDTPLPGVGDHPRQHRLFAIAAPLGHAVERGGQLEERHGRSPSCPRPLRVAIVSIPLTEGRRYPALVAREQAEGPGKAGPAEHPVLGRERTDAAIRQMDRRKSRDGPSLLKLEAIGAEEDRPAAVGADEACLEHEEASDGGEGGVIGRSPQWGCGSELAVKSESSRQVSERGRAIMCQVGELPGEQRLSELANFAWHSCAAIIGLGL